MISNNKLNKLFAHCNVGKPSSNATHPDYVPSVFSYVKIAERREDRFDRRRNRLMREKEHQEQEDKRKLEEEKRKVEDHMRQQKAEEEH